MEETRYGLRVHLHTLPESVFQTVPGHVQQQPDAVLPLLNGRRDPLWPLEGEAYRLRKDAAHAGIDKEE